VSCAFLSIAGFIFRGFLMMGESSLFDHKLRKILPHIIDTLLLLSALGMLWQWQINPFVEVWLLAKIIALLIYIGLGLVAFRFGKTKVERVVAWLSALLVIAYIIQTAITKNPWII